MESQNPGDQHRPHGWDKADLDLSLQVEDVRSQCQTGPAPSQGPVRTGGELGAASLEVQGGYP